MIGGLGYLLASGNAAFNIEHRCGQGYLGTDTGTGHSGEDCDGAARRAARALGRRRPPASYDAEPDARGELASCVVRPVLDGRYAERAESMARLLNVTRERYHEFRYRQDMDGSECVPVLLAALGRITGTDTGASGDSHEMIATAPDDAVVTDCRPAPAGRAGPVHRTSRSGRTCRPRPDVQRHLDGVGSRRTGGAASRRCAAGIQNGG